MHGSFFSNRLGSQMTDDREQKTDGRGQKTEYRWQKTDNRVQNSSILNPILYAHCFDLWTGNSDALASKLPGFPAFQLYPLSLCYEL
jgi:hypothetical protein